MITDSDGSGILKIKGTQQLHGGEKVNGITNLWKDADGETLYNVFTNADGSKTLNIHLKTGEVIFVKNWADGKLQQQVANDNEWRMVA